LLLQSMFWCAFDKEALAAERATEVTKAEEVVRPEPVYLNVYDLTDGPRGQLLYGFTQTGAYHAGVEAFGREYSFGAAAEGIYAVRPRRWNELRPYQTIAMGETNLSAKEFAKLIDRMQFQWLGSEYHVLSKNCCNFSRALLQELEAEPMPGWVDRGAREGACKVTSAVTQAACHVPHALVRGTGVGFAAFGGEIVAGQAGGLVGEAVGGDTGKAVGYELGRIGGAIGAGAAVGALGGPAGAAVGAGVGAASYVVGKGCDAVAAHINPNTKLLPDRDYSSQFNEDAARHGYFYLECELEDNRDGGKCVLAVEGNRDALGTGCICYTKKAERGQKWRLTEDGYLQSMHGDLYLAVAGNSFSSGAEVVIWKQKPAERGQRWAFEDGHLRNGQNCYLAVTSNGGEGYKIVTWDKIVEGGQRWKWSKE